MPTTHEYPISLEWIGGRSGRGSAIAENSASTIKLAVPAEFQGTGDGTNPEELLTTAIAACYTMTFGIIAENRKVPIAEVSVTATGEVEQNGASFTYRSVTVKPKIVLTSDATDEQLTVAEDLAHKADSYCIVTNAVRGKVEVRIEPSVTRK